MEYMKRIGIISRAYIKLVSNNKYVDRIRSEIEIPDQTIEVRKQYVYEKNIRSRILVIYAIESKAEEIDFNLL